MLFQIDIVLNELLYDDMDENNFALKLKKARTIAGYSQSGLAHITGLSRSCIYDLESGVFTNIQKDTLMALIQVLDKNILCDEYCNFILHQEDEIRKLILKFGMKKLCSILKVHRSTVERWMKGTYQVKKEKYILIKKIIT